MRSNLRFIRNMIYRLKRDFGSPADIYYDVSDQNDLGTGKRQIQIQKWHVRFAISLPRKQEQFSLFGAALRELMHRGANVVVGDRQIMIDRADLPKDLVLGTENWYILIDGKRYQVLLVEEYEKDLAYLITLKETVGAERDSIVSICLFDRIEISESAKPPLLRSVVPITVQDKIRITQTNGPAALRIGTDVEVTIIDSMHVGEKM